MHHSLQSNVAWDQAAPMGGIHLLTGRCWKSNGNSLMGCDPRPASDRFTPNGTNRRPRWARSDVRQDQDAESDQKCGQSGPADKTAGVAPDPGHRAVEQVKHVGRSIQ